MDNGAPLLTPRARRGFDYASYRERLKRATELTTEIAIAATGLAELISQFSATSVEGPIEFYSVPDLLHQTDNHEPPGHNLYPWRARRKHVLGDRKEQVLEPANQHKQALPHSKPKGEKEAEGASEERSPAHLNLPGDPAESNRLADLRHAWQVAPEFSALLNTVAKVARDFVPQESGVVGAAISRRQRNPRTEYLRGLAKLLTDRCQLTLDTPVLQAMVVVTNVVINDPNLVVTYDDVRKALRS